MAPPLEGTLGAPVLLRGTLAPRQLATNSTFETAAGVFTSTGWVAGSNNTIGSSALGEGYGGSKYSLKVTRTNGTAGMAYAATTVSNLVSGQKYRSEFWLKKYAGTTNPQVDMKIGGSISTSVFTATTTWQKVAYVFTAAATAYTFYIQLGEAVAESGSAILIDNFSVIKASVFEPLYASVSAVSVDQQATATIDDLRDYMGTATSDIADVTMSAATTLSDVVPMAADLTVDVQMDGIGAGVDALLAGSTGVDVRLGANALILMPMPSATATAYARTATSGFSIVSILTPNPIGMVFDTNAINRIRSVPYIPPDPEPAAPGTPTVAQGVYVRALHGVIVDMTNPTITDGKPT